MAAEQINSLNQIEASCEQHPNGRPIRGEKELTRPKRNDAQIEEDIFPNSTLGRLLQGTIRCYLIKQEYRLGWARKSACDDPVLLPHPCEVVAAHQWGVVWLIMTISRIPEFQRELPNFDRAKAYEMAATHDMPEIVTGDITPVDGISAEKKHQLEADAMDSILSLYSEEVSKALQIIYARYEDRQCQESRFVKDCDRLDFMITAFLLERQGFSGFYEFYPNSKRDEFSTQVARDLADLLTETRNSLAEENLLYKKE